MQLRRALAAGLAVFALAGSASGAHAVAIADTVYDFAGECSDCSGVATAELTLAGYTPGSALSPENFVSLNYDGTNMQAPYTLEDAFILEGALGTSPGYYNVDIQGYGPEGYFFFNTAVDGSWSTGPVNAADMGGEGTWNNGTTPISAAPEPSAWALMFAGIGGIGLMLRRAKKTTGLRFRDAFAA